MEILNHDLENFIRRERRYKKELIKSVSSNLSDFNVHDQTRFVEYINSLIFFLEWAVGQELLDLPESSPYIIEVEDLTKAIDMENDDVALLVRLFEVLEIEVVNSASARQSNAVSVHDQKRIMAVIKKIINFMTNYVAKTNPIDLPESSPMHALTGHGETGIKVS